MRDQVVPSQQKKEMVLQGNTPGIYLQAKTLAIYFAMHAIATWQEQLVRGEREMFPLVYRHFWKKKRKLNFSHRKA